MRRIISLIGFLAAMLLLARVNFSHADTVNVTDDTDVNLNGPNQINGANVTVFVRNVGTGGERHAFVRFDLSSIPPGSDVSQAILRFFVTDVQDPGSLDLHVVLGNWSEKTLKASIAPTIDSPFSTIAISSADKKKFVGIDVTQVVQDWLDGTQDNFGIAILPNETDPIRLQTDSKENINTSHPIELEVTLAGQGAPGPQGEIGPPGPAGEDGLDGISCWDLDSSGTCEVATEDLNNDNECTALDCKGAQGEQGEEGAQGLQGEIGPQGLQGESGPQGPLGPVGPQGETGPQGSPGPTGPVGPAGLTGEDGLDGISCWDLDSSGTCEVATEDLNGDNECTPVDCKGEQGEQGEQGEEGAQGPQGEIGPQGPQGLQGEAGSQGPVGPAGPQGPQGLQGSEGPQGPEGSEGPPGPSQVPGSTGPPFSCNAAAAGALYFNTNAFRFEGCNGTEWVQLVIASIVPPAEFSILQVPGSPPDQTQCVSWQTFRNNLSSNYNRIILTGDLGGPFTCDGSAVTTLINSIKSEQPVQVSCGGQTWNVIRYNAGLDPDGVTVSVEIGPGTAPNDSNCQNRAIRPCIVTGGNEGGLGSGSTPSCNAPQQQIDIRFE